MAIARQLLRIFFLGFNSYKIASQKANSLTCFGLYFFSIFMFPKLCGICGLFLLNGIIDNFALKYMEMYINTKPKNNI